MNRIMNHQYIDDLRITIRVYKTLLFYFIYLHSFLSLVLIFKISANLFNSIVPFIFNTPRLDLPDAMLAEYMVFLTYAFFYLAFYAFKFHEEEWLVVFLAGLLGFGMVPMAAMHQTYCNFDDGFMSNWTGTPCNLMFCIYSWVMLIIQLVILYFSKALWDLCVTP